MQGYHSINESLDNDLEYLDSEIEIIDDDEDDAACYTHNTIEALSNRVKLELFLVFVTAFILDAAKGIVTPSLLNYSDAIDGDDFFYGVLIGTFGIGTLVFGPVLGWLSSGVKVSNWLIFIAAIGLAMIGNLFYGLAWVLSQAFSFAAGRTALASARTILGSSVGAIAVARAHVSLLTVQSQRTSIITLLSASQFAAVTLTPIIGMALCNINMSWYNTVLNCLTSPGFLLVIISAIMAVVLAVAYGKFPRDSRSLRDPDEVEAKTKYEQKRPLLMPTIGTRTETTPTAMLVLLMVINSVVIGASAVVETQGGELFFGLFNSALGGSGKGSDSISDTQYDGYFFLVIGVIGLTVFALIYLYSLKYPNKLFDFTILLSGLIGLGIGALLLLQLNYHIPSSQHARGSSSYSTSTFDKIRFLMGSFLIINFARPMATTAIVALFSKNLPDDKQGLMMGWLTGFGALGQIFFPTFSRFGSETLAFVVATILTAFSIAGILMFRKQLVKNSTLPPEIAPAIDAPAPAATPLVYTHRR